MNYLSHFYFFKKENDPYYNCGLIFPDWLASFKRTKLVSNIVTGNNTEERIAAGVQNHFLGDKIFHSSSYFREHTHGIKLLLEKSNLDKEKFRFSFLAHILLEMMLDRLLLLKNPYLGTDFYDNLDKCDEDILLYFAMRNSRTDEGFLTLIQKFKQYRFLLQYIRTDSFVYSLSRITGRVGIIFNEKEQEEMVRQINIIEAYVNDSLIDLYPLFNTHEK
jgi:hypothetical protein